MMRVLSTGVALRFTNFAGLSVEPLVPGGPERLEDAGAKHHGISAHLREVPWIEVGGQREQAEKGKRRQVAGIQAGSGRASRSSARRSATLTAIKQRITG